MVLFVLVNVAFITLLERKILGYSQLRLGPSKPSFTGLLQPVRDAVKLFRKGYFSSLNRLNWIFFFRPLLAIGLVLLLWSVNMFLRPNIYFEYGLFLILVILGLNVYPVILRGWSSNRKYTFIGRVRGVAQSISYEISLAFIIMSLIQLVRRISLISLFHSSNYFTVVIIFPILFFIWFLRGLAERNRTPFDFAEGERELVSGFNTEYGGGGFAIIFIAEYGSIYFLSCITVFIFINTYIFIFNTILVRILIFFWVWVRRTYPRYRYDILMNLAWKRLLPLSIFYLVLCFIISW